MELYLGYGNINSDKLSNEYIHVNNFGYTKNIDKTMLTERENGRLDYQILYLDSGYGYFLIEGEFVKAESGDVILLYPRTKQYYLFNEDSYADSYWIHFAGSGVDELLKRLNLSQGIYHTGNFFAFKESIDKMSQAKAENNFTTEPFISATLFTLLTLTAKKIFTQTLFTHTHAMNKIIDEIHKEKFNTHTNADYALMCGMSEGYFIKTFKEITGMAPHQYKVRQTIHKATDLLDASNLNISEIADILGFEDSLYFSRLFKKEVGVAPTVFRRENKHSSSDMPVE